MKRQVLLLLDAHDSYATIYNHNPTFRDKTNPVITIPNKEDHLRINHSKSDTANAIPTELQVQMLTWKIKNSTNLQPGVGPNT